MVIVGELGFRGVALDHPDAALLIGRLDAYYREIYGGGDATPVDPAEFAPPHGRFTVGYAGAEPVACGGWRARDGGDPALRPGDAEVKRMYVDAGHRGRGHARALVAHLEETARAAGRRRMVLETGLRQPAAMALYTACGYAPTACFGVYRDEPGARCYAKPLDG